MYIEIINKIDSAIGIAIVFALAGYIIGIWLTGDGGGGILSGIICSVIAFLFCGPYINAQKLAIEQLPYHQEKAAIIEEATNIECCLYRDADGNYFFLHEFSLSEKDLNKNGPKFMRVDVPVEKAADIVVMMKLQDDGCNCNIYYNFERLVEEARVQYLSEHPEMADDYEEKR